MWIVLIYKYPAAVDDFTSCQRKRIDIDPSDRMILVLVRGGGLQIARGNRFRVLATAD